MRRALPLLLAICLSPAARTAAQEPGQPALFPAGELTPPLPDERIVEGAPAGILALAFGSDGASLDGAGPGGELLRWAAADGRRLAGARVPGTVRGLGALEGGAALVVLADGSTWRWQPPAPPELLRPPDLRPLDAWGFGTGAVALAFADGAVETWRAGQDGFVTSLASSGSPAGVDPGARVAALLPTPLGVVLARRDGTLERWRDGGRDVLGHVAGTPVGLAVLGTSLFVALRSGALVRIEAGARPEVEAGGAPEAPSDRSPSSGTRLASGLRELRALAASPDGARLVLAGADEPRLLLWSVANARPIGFVADAGAPPTAVAIASAADGAVRFAVAGDTVRLGTLSAQLLRQRGAVLEGRPAPVIAGALSPDGALLALGTGRGDAWLWDVRTGAARGAFRPDGHAVIAVDFLASGRLALLTDGGRVALAEPATGALDVLEVATEAPLTALVAAGKQLVVGDGAGELQLLRADTSGEPLARWSAHGGPVTELALSADGARLASAAGGRTTVWLLPEAERATADRRAPERLRLAQVEGDAPAAVLALAFRAGGTELLSAHADGVVRRWSLADGRLLAEHAGFERPRALGLFADERHAIVGDASGRLTRLDLEGEEPRVPIVRHAAACAWAGLVTGGRFLVSADREGDVRLFEVETGRALRAWPGDGGEIVDLAADASGRYLVSGAGDGWARLWDLAEERVAFLVEGHGGALTRLVFQRDGRQLLTAGADGQLRVWRTDDGTCPRLVQVAEGAIQDLRLLAGDEELVVLATDGTVRRLAVGEATTAKMARGIAARVAAFAPDGVRLATGEGALLRVRRGTALDGAVVAEWPVPSPLSALAWSDDGRWIAAGDEAGVVALVDPRGGTRHESVRHPGPVRALRFAADGRTLASLGTGSLVRLWDVERGESAGVLAGHPGGTTAVSFVGAALVATGGRFGRVRLWSRASGQLVSELATWDGPGWTFRTRAAQGGGARLWRGTDGTVVDLWSEGGPHPLDFGTDEAPLALAVEPLPLRADVNPRFGLRLVNEGAEPVLGLRLEGGRSDRVEVLGPWFHARLAPGEATALPAYVWRAEDGGWPDLFVVDLQGRRIRVELPREAFAPAADRDR